MAGQRRVAGMELALPPLQDRGGDGLGVVPPDFLGDAAEELEGGDHTGEDGLGALEWQRQDERRVGVGPGGDQERHGPSAVGEVDVDVAEIGLEPPARKMGQRDEGLLMSAFVLEYVALDLTVAAAVAVLVLEATKDLHGGVALLGGCLLVVGQDTVDDRLEGTDDGGGSVPGVGARPGLAMGQDMPNGPARVSESTGDLPDGQAIAARPANGAVVVHRKHFLNLREGESFHVGTFTIHGCARVGPSYALRLPMGGPLLRAQHHSENPNA